MYLRQSREGFGSQRHKVSKAKAIKDLIIKKPNQTKTRKLAKDSPAIIRVLCTSLTPESNPWIPQRGRREPIHKSYPMTSNFAPEQEHMPAQTLMHTHGLEVG